MGDTPRVTPGLHPPRGRRGPDQVRGDAAEGHLRVPCCCKPQEWRDDVSSSDDSPVYVFEVPALRVQKKNGGEPVRQEFPTQKEAMEWLMQQLAHKKFVMLRVINGGGEKPT